MPVQPTARNRRNKSTNWQIYTNLKARDNTDLPIFSNIDDATSYAKEIVGGFNDLLNISYIRKPKARLGMPDDWFLLKKQHGFLYSAVNCEVLLKSAECPYTPATRAVYHQVKVSIQGTSKASKAPEPTLVGIIVEKLWSEHARENYLNAA
ncbi:Protein of unknown function [Pyronema omphalodes CBS 100304]|uniref:Uncharacterized protein n=1 Tax=Pyronema omphalodes (strain CBS 100304) TaxID=1076935 RepID=U4LSA2_PYROM|nr:Protein of unknown function [Pyronema omphalodes CBS 100304]